MGEEMAVRACFEARWKSESAVQRGERRAILVDGGGVGRRAARASGGRFQGSPRAGDADMAGTGQARIKLRGGLTRG